MRNLFLILSISLISAFSYGQNIDSLINSLQKNTEKEKPVTLNKIARAYIRVDLKKTLEYADKAIKAAEQINDKKSEAYAYLYKAVVFKKQNDFNTAKTFFLKSTEFAKNIDDTLLSKAYNNLAQIEYDLGNYDKAKEYITKTIELKKSINDLKGQAVAYNTLGNIYLRQSDNKKAIENFQKALRIFDKINLKSGIAKELNAIGAIYENIANYKNVDKLNEALNFYKQALKINLEINSKPDIANSYSNIGNIYSQLLEILLNNNKANKEKIDSLYYNAKNNLLESLKIREEIGDLRGITTSNINLSALYILNKEYDKAIEHANAAVKSAEKSQDYYNLSVSYYYLASLNFKLGKYKDAINAINKSIEISHKTSMRKNEMEAYSLYSDIYDSLGDYKNAYHKLKHYISLKDSVLNEESTKIIEELNKKYQTEKKDQELKLKNAELKQKDLENSRQKLLIYGFAVVILLIIAFAVMVFKQYKQKKKANEVLAAKNELITKQKEEITDSILYAKRIQTAILPQEDYITESLSEQFILFKPRDIVSGDFYWIKEVKRTNITYCTAADCTGHGVPGAFMSMLGVAFLNEIISRQGVKTTGEILDQLRESVITSLHQTGKEGEAKDGMDISFIAIDKQNMKLQFSGANNPLYIIRSKDKTEITADKTISSDTHTLYEIKGDKMPIGIYGGESKNFKTIEIDLIPGDILYLFSDGYADQFGGPKSKKYKYKPFKKLLLTVAEKPMETQKEIILKEHMDWKGNNEQIDDIIVIGIRV